MVKKKKKKKRKWDSHSTAIHYYHALQQQPHISYIVTQEHVTAEVVETSAGQLHISYIIT